MSKSYTAVQRSGQQDNELTHWKYIRREYNHGKYRYYYSKTKNPGSNIGEKIGYAVKDAVGIDEKKAYETARNTHQMYKDDVLMKRKGYGYLINSFREEGRDDLAKSWIEPARRDINYSKSHLKNTALLEEKALSEYKKTPIYKVDKAKETVNKGVTWLKKKLAIH